MRLDGFSVVAHSDEQRTFPVPCNYPRKMSWRVHAERKHLCASKCRI